METSQNSNIELQKEFSVTKDRLYQSWISPEDLKKWWTPLNSKLIEVENDVQRGGQIKYSFKTDSDQETITITGDYLEVKENEQLIYNWNWQTGHNALGTGKYKLTISFADADQGSTITVKQESTVEDESLLPHKEGWEKSLNDLSTYLNEGEDKTAGAGYNELPDQEKVGG
jgi:uncharacterized protein YndB with AHSA1/START domain